MIETKIIRTVISQFPAIVPHLKGRARWIAFAFSSKGGEGSGNFGHAGRPGEVGGSAPNNAFSIQTESVGSYGGQVNYISRAYTENGNISASLQYSVINGIPHIDMIEAYDIGTGAASSLINELSSIYGYENIEWGMMTDDGYLFRNRMDEKYGVTREFISYSAEDINNNFSGTSFSDNRLDFNSSVSLDRYEMLLSYLNKIGADNIEVDIAENEVFITARLPEDTEIVNKKIKSYKTAEYFQSELERMVQNVYAGNLGGSFIDIMANLISGQLRQATEQAWNDRDGEGELPDYLTAAYETAVLGQYDHVDQFYRDIVDARVDETPIDPLLSRAAMWASQWDTMYRNALLLIDTNNGGNLIWRKGETEHGCATCAALDGIVMWASEWDALGVHPRGYPNNKLECQGGGPANNCDCTLEPTDQRRTAGAYGRVEEIIL